MLQCSRFVSLFPLPQKILGVLGGRGGGRPTSAQGELGSSVLQPGGSGDGYTKSVEKSIEEALK
jgi:hypothetical protein